MNASLYGFLCFIKGHEFRTFLHIFKAIQPVLYKSIFLVSQDFYFISLLELIPVEHLSQKWKQEIGDQQEKIREHPSNKNANGIIGLTSLMLMSPKRLICSS